MSTATYTNWSRCNIAVEYSITTNNDTTYSIHVTKITYTSKNSNGKRRHTVMMDIRNGSGTVYATVQGSPGLNKDTNASSETWTKNVYANLTKAHSTWDVYAYITLKDYNSGDTWHASLKLATVPVKTSYAVSYAANGGSSTPAKQTKWYGETLTLQAGISHADTSPGNYTVTLNGNGAANPSALTSKRTTKYTFSSWKATNGSTYASKGSYTANAATTMTAQWSTTESRAAVTLPTPTRSGFTFVRWNTNNTNTGSGYNAGSYTPSGNVTLYAIWNRTVTYNGNAPSGKAVSNVPASQTAVATSSISITTSTPSCPGYRFVRWATASDGTGTSYVGGDSYPSESASVTLYAIWAKNIDAVSIGTATAIRTDTLDPSDATESDEGTCALLTVPFTVSGDAAADIAISAELKDALGETVDTVTDTDAKPESSAPYSGTFSLRFGAPNGADALSTESSYSFDITVTATNTTVTQNPVSDSQQALLNTAYFTMDVLGDSKLYQLTADADLVAGKSYYTRSGQGTQENPYLYELVENPVTADIGGYYEKNGSRPGHGMAFGAPATHEAFNVAMPPECYGEPWVPTFRTNSIASFAVPNGVEECFIYDVTLGVFFEFINGVITQVGKESKTISFNTSYVNSSNCTLIRMNGMVHMLGSANFKGHTSRTVMCNVPAGWRSYTQCYGRTTDSSGGVLIIIDANGNISFDALAAGNHWFSATWAAWN